MLTEHKFQAVYSTPLQDNIISHIFWFSDSCNHAGCALMHLLMLFEKGTTVIPKMNVILEKVQRGGGFVIPNSLSDGIFWSSSFSLSNAKFWNKGEASKVVWTFKKTSILGMTAIPKCSRTSCRCLVKWSLLQSRVWKGNVIYGPWMINGHSGLWDRIQISQSILASLNNLLNKSICPFELLFPLH